MTLRQYLIIMGLSTVLCWTAWVFVLLNVDPFQTSVLGFFFFYISLFLALLGTTSLAAFGLYHFFSRVELPMFRFVEKSFRDALIIAVLLLAFLSIQSTHVVPGWIVGTIVLALAVGGVIFLQVRRTVTHDRS